VKLCEGRGSIGEASVDIANPDGFFRAFPALRRGKVNVTSPVDAIYNCIAWAANDNKRWWWPSVYSYWPSTVDKKESIDAFGAVFETLGYTQKSSSEFEKGKEKVALFALAGKPTHAARQLPDGSWTSKCGKNVDISHDLTDVEGPVYGQVVLIL
jgi:hypothetical protein